MDHLRLRMGLSPAALLLFSPPPPSLRQLPPERRPHGRQQVLRAMPGDGGLAFYNCGPASGHSQPHKHVQARPPPL